MVLSVAGARTLSDREGNGPYGSWASGRTGTDRVDPGEGGYCHTMASNNHSNEHEVEPGGEVLGGPEPTTTEKDPEDWVTGDEPMTGAQQSYLDTLARQAGEEIPADLTKAEASEHIDRLQEQTGRRPD